MLHPWILVLFLLNSTVSELTIHIWEIVNKFSNFQLIGISVCFEQNRRSHNSWVSFVGSQCVWKRNEWLASRRDWSKVNTQLANKRKPKMRTGPVDKHFIRAGQWISFRNFDVTKPVGPPPSTCVWPKIGHSSELVSPRDYRGKMERTYSAA